MANPYAPPPYSQSYGQALGIDYSELRPRRGWFVVAGIVAAVGVLAGVVLFAVGIVTRITGMPNLEQQFENGEPVTVRMAADEVLTIYGTGRTYYVQCSRLDSSRGGVTISRVSFAFAFAKGGGSTWEAVYEVHATRHGTYTFVCSGNNGIFAFGNPPHFARFFGTIVGSVLAMVVLPLLGVLSGAVIALVVGIRRNAHRKRLQAESPHPYRLPQRGRYW